MGIYDRDYYQERRPRVQYGGDRPMVVNLLIATVGIFVADLFLQGELSRYFALRSDLASRPWQAYQLLTYGFLHDTHNLVHIVSNMLGLWFFGREVEWRYGRTEFLWLYLSLIILSGMAWLAMEQLTATGFAQLIGASGAVTGVLLLFALNFPHRTVLLWFALPIPAWLLAVLLIVMDLRGATTRAGNVAYTCHLAGAALAFLYFRTGWTLQRLLPSRIDWKKLLLRRPKLRVHQPESGENDFRTRVDEVLKKIQEHGQDSLSESDRQVLADASRRYQKKRR
jgi:membrane associated rhomboid family serine protease